MKSHASLVTYESLEELDQATQTLIVEDWKSYTLHTVLSNNTINGIGYQGENSLGEPIVTLGSNCRISGLWCISHLTDNGRTRSFGSRSVTFSFNDPIQSFSLFLIQGINEPVAGQSSWSIDFDTGESLVMDSIYELGESFGLSYLGASGINGATAVTIRQTRNDTNVVWAFNHIGYETLKVSEPTTMVSFLILIAIYMIRFKLRERN
ncbi:hypothetical protein [Agaribacter marinus]|uniref:hypothetical protein n=1 Tax=Agaribacter marinus TaxID=1431249 RepID=UPI0024E0CF7E|nr:hypothetical protein [Agaribacter marinus]